MSNKKFYEDSTFWVGAASYYGLSWLLTFYPAFIFGLAICQQTDSSMLEYSELFGLIWMLVAYGLIQFMILTEKYVAVVIVYIATLWPFLCVLKHYWDNAGAGDAFPLPPVNWIPFF